jgi:MFS family permease
MTHDGAPPSTGFGRFWAASTTSAFGSTITAVALPVLVVDGLTAGPVEVGIVNAAQFVPYAVLGLVAGAYVDRWRRRPTLVVASIGRALCLATIPLLWVLGALSVWNLIVLLLLFGGFSVFGFAASQSLLPRLVARDRLLRANAQLDQGEAAAQTLGPTLAGLLVRWLGAPFALVVDAVSYVVDAVLVATIPVREAPDRGRRPLGAAIREGLHATYRHPVLLPLSLSTHVWFVANAAGMTILSLLVLRTLDLGAALFGLLLSVVGASTLAGAAAAERVGSRFGPGSTITAARALYPLAWTGVALVPAIPSPSGTILLFVALAVGGLAAGIENANEMSYRQQAVRDGLLGRVNATGRSVNRTAGALGAVLGGVLASAVGVASSIWFVAGIFAIAAGIAAFSPLRRAGA